MRTDDLRGPFRYGRYGTETAWTVVIGDAETVGAQVYCLLLLYTLFVATISVISFRQGKSQPSRTRLHVSMDITRAQAQQIGGCVQLWTHEIRRKVHSGLGTNSTLLCRTLDTNRFS
jgi:hypothetical protein